MNTYIYMCIYICMHGERDRCIYISVCTHLYTYINVYRYFYVYMHIPICAHLCVYMYERDIYIYMW